MKKNVMVWVDESIAHQIRSDDLKMLPPSLYMCANLFTDYMHVEGLNLEECDLTEEDMENEGSTWSTSDIAICGMCEVSNCLMTEVIPLDCYGDFDGFKKALEELQDSTEYLEAMEWEEKHAGENQEAYEYYLESLPAQTYDFDIDWRFAVLIADVCDKEVSFKDHELRLLSCFLTVFNPTHYLTSEGTWEPLRPLMGKEERLYYRLLDLSKHNDFTANLMSPVKCAVSNAPCSSTVRVKCSLIEGRTLKDYMEDFNDLIQNKDFLSSSGWDIQTVKARAIH